MGTDAPREIAHVCVPSSPVRWHNRAPPMTPTASGVAACRLVQCQDSCPCVFRLSQERENSVSRDYRLKVLRHSDSDRVRHILEILIGTPRLPVYRARSLRARTRALTESSRQRVQISR